MTIELGPELETMLASLPHDRGKTPEEFAFELLAQRIKAKAAWRQPQADFERQLRALSKDCGVSLSDEALSREELDDRWLT